MWSRERLLVWGKTYPEFSRTYYETVCTGAVREITGRLVRLYPITLRYGVEPFRLYQWIEAEIERNESDFRPESYKIRQATIKPLEAVGTKDGWTERSRWVLMDKSVFVSVESLLDAEDAGHTSLGLVKPSRVIRVYARQKSQSEREEWEEKRRQALQQKDLFVDPEAETKELVFIPVEYRVEFRCGDDRCNGHDMSIRDWGLYQLSRKLFARYGSGPATQDKVIRKVLEVMEPPKRDAYFFLGNTVSHPRNFMIVGFYYPPLRSQRVAKRGPTETPLL